MATPKQPDVKLITREIKTIAENAIYRILYLEILEDFIFHKICMCVRARARMCVRIFRTLTLKVTQLKK